MAFIVMVRKTAGKRTLERPKMRWNVNVNIELRKMRWGCGVDLLA